MRPNRYSSGISGQCISRFRLNSVITSSSPVKDLSIILVSISSMSLRLMPITLLNLWSTCSTSPKYFACCWLSLPVSLVNKSLSPTSIWDFFTVSITLVLIAISNCLRDLATFSPSSGLPHVRYSGKAADRVPAGSKGFPHIGRIIRRGK